MECSDGRDPESLHKDSKVTVAPKESPVGTTCTVTCSQIVFTTKCTKKSETLYEWTVPEDVVEKCGQPSGKSLSDIQFEPIFICESMSTSVTHTKKEDGTTLVKITCNNKNGTTTK